MDEQTAQLRTRIPTNYMILLDQKAQELDRKRSEIVRYALKRYLYGIVTPGSAPCNGTEGNGTSYSLLNSA